ncbi:MAG: hypothetical protein Q9181_000222 [Wetmoreana brouardii]
MFMLQYASHNPNLTTFTNHNQDRNTRCEQDAFSDGAKSLDNWTKGGHIWIRDDLPEDIATARVMTFGYNASYTGDATAGRIRDFGKQLLEALRIEREQCPTRPLLFVCHSLGGLVVKRAMVEASPTKARHADIYDSAFGIIFLATPHRGSPTASIGKILVNISKVSLKQNKTQLLAELERDNPSLTDLTEDFSRLHSHFLIASAWELAATDVAFYLPKITIVPSESAKMGIENEILLPLSADHFSICKFQSSDDPLYKQVKGLINEFVKKGVVILASRRQMSALAAGVQSSLGPQSPNQSPSIPNPFLQITKEERDNALKTSETQPIYRATTTKDFRTCMLKLLHSTPWQTLSEDVINKDHWWPPVSDEARSVRGKWIMYYPPGTKLAKVDLSIDWHAYEGDPLEPLIEWTIHTPESEYHPGKHYGLFIVRKIHIPKGSSGLGPTMHVVWKSAIYSPFVRDRDPGDGSIVGDAVFEQAPIDLTEILESLAHVLLYGPFDSPTEIPAPIFRLRHENPRIWKGYEKQSPDDKEAFKRAASFFARAYNQDPPDKRELPIEKHLLPKALVTSVKTLRELVELYLGPRELGNWDFRAFGTIDRWEMWALEEKKEADKIINACNLEYLKLYRQAQIKQDEYQKFLAMRSKTAVGD